MWFVVHWFIDHARLDQIRYVGPTELGSNQLVTRWINEKLFVLFQECGDLLPSGWYFGSAQLFVRHFVEQYQL